MKTTRGKLRELLTERLVPLLFQAGFRGPQKISGNKLFHDYKRNVGESVQVLSIQFEKWQLPRFVINLEVEPPEGIEAVIARGGENVTGRLQPHSGPSTRSWFRADRPWWQRIISRRPPDLANEAVDECIRLLPEVETWWTTQSPSEHITCDTFKFVGSQKAKSKA